MVPVFSLLATGVSLSRLTSTWRAPILAAISIQSVPDLREIFTIHAAFESLDLVMAALRASSKPESSETAAMLDEGISGGGSEGPMSHVVS